MENEIKICFVFCYVLKSYSETLFLLHYSWIILDLWVSKEIRETVHFLENNILSYIFWVFSSLILFFFCTFAELSRRYTWPFHEDWDCIGRPRWPVLSFAWLNIQDRCVQTDSEKRIQELLANISRDDTLILF